MQGEQERGRARRGHHVPGPLGLDELQEALREFRAHLQREGSGRGARHLGLGLQSRSLCGWVGGYSTNPLDWETISGSTNLRARNEVLAEQPEPHVPVSQWARTHVEGGARGCK